MNSNKNKLHSKIRWQNKLAKWTLRVCLDTAYYWKLKHCSKIIFKCVNSTVRPSFEEKIVELDNLWVLWTVHETHCIRRKQAETEFQRNPNGGLASFGYQWKVKIISLFSLFLLLFIDSTALFITIHRLYCTISANFYIYLQYFQ